MSNPTNKDGNNQSIKTILGIKSREFSRREKSKTDALFEKSLLSLKQKRDKKKSVLAEFSQLNNFSTDSSDSYDDLPVDYDSDLIVTPDVDHLEYDDTPLIHTPVPDIFFKNPSEENAVKVSEFLQQLDLTPIQDILKSFYGEDYRKKYPPLAMLRASLFKKIKKIRYYTDLHKYLTEYSEDALNLGFEYDKNGKVAIPNHRTFRHFEAERLGRNGMELIFDTFVKEITKQLKKYGITVGDNVAIDSTPLEDNNGDYNPKYKKAGYKLHNLIDTDTNIPLSHATSDMKDFDGWYLTPLLEKAQIRGCKIDTIYADNHYSTFDNYATVNVIFGAKPYFNLSETDVIHEEATKERLDELYDSFVGKDYYVRDADDNYKHMILIAHGYKELVGQYYRNSTIREKEECPDGYIDAYHQRSKVEGHHGAMKVNLLLEVAMNRRGLENTHRHATMSLIALLSVVLARVQFGYTENLTRMNGLV